MPTVMYYLACMDMSWSSVDNHERISTLSVRHLQTTREDFDKLKDAPIDPDVPIVGAVIDCTTDHRHFHFCKANTGAEASAALLKKALEEEEEEVTLPLPFARSHSALSHSTRSLK